MATRAARLARLTDRKVEVQQQFITFNIRSMGFLMPIEAVHRAIVFTHDCHPVRYINFEQEILPVVSVEQHIFNGIEEAKPSSEPSQQQIALVIEPLSGASAEAEHRIALPIDSPPSLCRIADSELFPLPKTYEMKCVDGMTKANANQPFQFLMNPNQLVESQAKVQLNPTQLASLMTSETLVLAQPLDI